MEHCISEPGLEHVRCNLCGAEDASLLFRVPVRDHQRGRYARDIWDVVRCRQCGLVYTNPRPDEAARKSFYAFKDPEDMRYVEDWFIGAASFQRPTWQRYLRVLKSVQARGRLLDVGCGAGSFLLEARGQEYEVAGYEVSSFFIQYCRDRLGLPVFTEALATLQASGHRFDVITAFDVIEHHPDPKALIRQMRALLGRNGVIAVTTHDIGNPWARLYGPKWRHLQPVGHLTYFDRRTLSRLIRSSGFEIARIGGAHTIDATASAELHNWFVQFGRLIFLRSIILGIYKPIASRFPFLARWKTRVGGAVLDHRLLLLRAGKQVIMNDEVLLVAVAREGDHGADE